MLADAIPLLARLIETGAALVVVRGAARAAAALIRSGGSDVAITRVRLLLSQAVVTALGVMTAATLLKSTQLRTWSAIGAFAAILTLRTAVKRALAWEAARIQPSLARAAR